MSIFSLLAARSVSIFETPACANRFFSVCAQRQILVQQLRVVAVRVPARPPRLVEPEPESERVNFLAHGYSFAFLCGFFRRRRRRLLRRRARFGRGASAPASPTATTFSGRSATCTVRCAVRFSTRNARPIGAGRTRFCDGPWFA